MLYSGAKLSASGCDFTDNQALHASTCNWGGAIYALGTKIAAERSRFRRNLAEGGNVNAAGGALAAVYSDLDVSECEFVENTARSVRQAERNGMYGVNGGALFMTTCKDAALRSVIAKDNVAHGIDLSTQVQGGFG